jgi:outer membrane protein TolC
LTALAVGLGCALATTPALSAQRAAPTAAALALSRQAAIDSALSRNPQLEAARQQIAQAKARVTEARALPDLGLAYTVSDEAGLFRPGGGTSNEFDVGMTIPFPSRLVLRGRVAGADVESSRFDYQGLRQQLASATAQAYDALLVAQQHARDLREGQQLAEEFLKRTEARFEGGTAAKLDVIKARVELAQAANDLIATERDISNARASLNRLMGRPLGADLELTDSLAVPPAIPDLDSLEVAALRLRPELRSLAAQRAGANSAVSLAKQYWVPDIDLTLGRIGGGGAPATWSTEVGIGFPLFFWQHHNGEVAEAEHHRQELNAVASDLTAQIAQEVRTAHADASTALRQAVYLRDELVPEAREAYRIASVSYGLGGSSTLEVLDARRTLLDAQSQYADALGAVNDAVAQLELAVGGPLDSSARLPGDPDAQ